MLSPEEPQVKIYMLKAGLDDTKNAILSQADALLSLEEESEQMSEANKKALQESNNLSAELESLKLENVRLSAKRIQITRQCEDAAARLNRAKENREQILQQIRDEQADIEAVTRQYEDHLFEIAERYRQTPIFAVEEVVKMKKEELKGVLSELESEEAKHQNIVQLLQRELDSIGTGIPEDILDILGKHELEEKIKAINAEVEALTQKRDNFSNYPVNLALFPEQTLQK